MRLPLCSRTPSARRPLLGNVALPAATPSRRRCGGRGSAALCFAAYRSTASPQSSRRGNCPCLWPLPVAPGSIGFQGHLVTARSCSSPSARSAARRSSGCARRTRSTTWSCCGRLRVPNNSVGQRTGSARQRLSTLQAMCKRSLVARGRERGHFRQCYAISLDSGLLRACGGTVLRRHTMPRDGIHMAGVVCAYLLTLISISSVPFHVRHRSSRACTLPNSRAGFRIELAVAAHGMSLGGLIRCDVALHP
mmetsp:Transcript_123366/g.383919  ORF Transcript_123366/g.383919 Transcript_123366/m.383919 type:complete len:250 (-) Transcript_123366:84-833(-)